MTKILHFEDKGVIADADDWRSALAAMTYTPTETKEIEGYQFQVFKRKLSGHKQDWALYHPAIAGLDDTESVYIFVPTADAIEDLIEIAEQMILPITALAEMRSLFSRQDQL